MRDRCEDLRLDAEPGRHGGSGVSRLVGHDDEVGADLEFDRVVAVTGAGLDPPQLLVGLLRRGAGDAGGAELAGRVVEVDADHIRDPAR